MAIAYYAEDIQLPAIKKKSGQRMDQGGGRDLREEDRRYQLHLLLGREDLGGKPPISPTRLLHGYHHL